MSARVPPTLSTRRWQKLAPGSRAVLAAVALHEDDLPDALLAALALQPEDVDPLVADGWLGEQHDGSWRLKVPAETVRALAPWSLRRSAHLALARLLQRTVSGWTRAARHLEQGGQPDDAGRLWLAAARQHCKRHQHRVAGECFVEAIRLLPDTTPETELVEAVRDVGVCAALQRNPAKGLDLLQRWRDHPAWRALHRFQAHAAGVAADLESRLSRPVEAASLRRVASRAWSAAGEPDQAAAESLAAAGTLVWGMRFHAARETVAEAIAQARACQRADLESQALAMQGLMLGMLGDPAAGRATLEAAADLALKHRFTALAADAYRLMGNVNEYASCYDDVSAFRAAISYCSRHEKKDTAHLCRGCMSYSLYRGGRWREAERLATQVAKPAHLPDVMRLMGWAVQGLIRVMRGELRTGVPLMEKTMAVGRSHGFAGVELIVWPTLATAYETAGRTDDAAVCYRNMLDAWRTTEDRHDVLLGLGLAVTFHARRGERDAAGDYAAVIQRIATDSPNAEARGTAHHAAGELKLLDGQAAEAAQAFGQALAAYSERNCCLELIRTRIRLGVALAAAGDIKAASEALRESRARASRLGCRPLAAIAAQELTRITGSSSSPTSNPLSPRQREVANQLVAGRTNKEIAHHLGLSVRTVDMHVSHLFMRLDCRTRTEAAHKLAALPKMEPGRCPRSDD